MSTVGSYDKTAHLGELNDPLFTNEGVKSPTERKALVRQNIGLLANVDELNDMPGSGVRTATATADGLTTGLLEASDTFVLVTSSSANNIMTLPSASSVFVGKIIRLWVGANGCELRTPATSNETINGGDADSNESAVPANNMVTAVCVSSTGWIVGVQSAPVPD